MCDRSEKEFERLWGTLRDEVRALLDEVRKYESEFHIVGYDDGGWLRREVKIEARLAAVKCARCACRDFFMIGGSDE